MVLTIRQASDPIAPAVHLHRFLDAWGLAGCNFPLLVLWFALPAVGFCFVSSLSCWLCSSACCWHLLFSVLFNIAPDLRCSSRAVLVPVLLYFIVLFFSPLALWRWFRLCSSFFWRRLLQHYFGVVYCFEVCLMHLQRHHSACTAS